MGLFSRNNKLEEINQRLTASFTNVKQDTNKIFSWLNFLYNQNRQYEQQIKDLQLQVKYLPKKEEIKQLVDFYYSQQEHKESNEELKEITSSMIKLASNQQNVFDRLEELSKKVAQLELQKPKTSFKERIIKKLSKSSKDYVKTIVLSFIKKYEKISGLQLREIVVEEQGLCSKSSFYRILEEIEKDEEIAVIHKGKNKYILHKAIKSI